jgi:hypothetical protein
MAEVVHTRPAQDIAAAMRRAKKAAEAVEKDARSLLENARRSGQALLEAQDACQREGMKAMRVPLGDSISEDRHLIPTGRP